MTVESIHTLFQVHKDVDAIEDSLLHMWLNAINTEAYSLLCNIVPEKYIKQSTVLIVGDTEAYTLPTDFKNINELHCGLYLDGVEQRFTHFGSTEQGFYLNGDNLVITPTPTDAQTAVLRYIPSVALISSDADILVIPDGYDDLVIEELYIKYDKREEEDAGLISISQRFSDDFRKRLMTNIVPHRHKTLPLRFR